MGKSHSRIVLLIDTLLLLSSTALITFALWFTFLVMRDGNVVIGSLPWLLFVMAVGLSFALLFVSYFYAISFYKKRKRIRSMMCAALPMLACIGAQWVASFFMT